MESVRTNQNLFQNQKIKKATTQEQCKCIQEKKMFKRKKCKAVSNLVLVFVLKGMFTEKKKSKQYERNKNLFQR